MNNVPEIHLNSDDDTAYSESILLFLAILHSNGGSVDISYDDLDKFEDASQGARYMIAIRMDDINEKMTVIAQEIPEGRMN